MQKLMVATVLAGGFALASVGTASADQIVVDVPQQAIFDSWVGKTHQLAQQSVPVEDQGLVCSGNLVAQNNESVHPLNDLRVSTGTSQVVLRDVEASPDKVTPLATPLTLGPDIRVELIMGPDGIYSGAFRLELQCEQPVPAAPPTTSPAAGVVVVAPPATPSVPSTAAPQAESPTVPPTVAAGVATTAVAPSSGSVVAVAPVAPAAPAAPAAATSQQLPATGADRAVVVAAIAALLLGAGVSLSALARRTGDA